MLFSHFFLTLVLAVFVQGANVLQGKVVAPSGTQPANSVRVKLTFNGKAIHETFTDLSGRFSFPDSLAALICSLPKVTGSRLKPRRCRRRFPRLAPRHKLSRRTFTCGP